MAPNDFNGQVALVTGGGSGIGRATCLLLARDGARVVVTDLNLEAARQTVTLMPNHEDHLALQMDVTKKNVVEGVFEEAKKKFGVSPTLLVNNAGIIKSNPFHLIQEEDFDSVLDVNLKGTFLVSQTFTKAVLEESESSNRRSAIVNVSSLSGKTGFASNSQYAASKGGVISLTKTCAAELAKKGVRVNCVLPGFTDTTMLDDSDEKWLKQLAEMIPLGRIGQPEEVAEVIVFLLSWRSSYMVGACVEVSGGFRM